MRRLAKLSPAKCTVGKQPCKLCTQWIIMNLNGPCRPLRNITDFASAHLRAPNFARGVSVNFHSKMTDDKPTRQHLNDFIDRFRLIEGKKCQVHSSIAITKNQQTSYVDVISFSTCVLMAKSHRSAGYPAHFGARSFNFGNWKIEWLQNKEFRWTIPNYLP